MALNDFTYYANRNLGGIGADEIDSDRARAMLAELQKYDPQANFRPVYGSEGNLTGYALDYNASKLPGMDGSGSLTGGATTGSNYMPNFSTVSRALFSTKTSHFSTRRSKISLRLRAVDSSRNFSFVM